MYVKYQFDHFRDENQSVCLISTHLVNPFIHLPRSNQYEIYYLGLALKSHTLFSSPYNITFGFRSARFYSVCLNMLQH